MIVSSDMSLTPRATIALQEMGFPVVSSKELIVDTLNGGCSCVESSSSSKSSSFCGCFFVVVVVVLLLVDMRLSILLAC